MLQQIGSIAVAMVWSLSNLQFTELTHSLTVIFSFSDKILNGAPLFKVWSAGHCAHILKPAKNGEKYGVNIKLDTVTLTLSLTVINIICSATLVTVTF